MTKRAVAEKKRKKPPVLETTTEKAVHKRFKEVQFVSKKEGLDGWPDRKILVGDGLHFWVELKNERVNKKLRALQKVVIKKLRAIDDKVYVIDDATDIEPVIHEWVWRRDRMRTWLKDRNAQDVADAVGPGHRVLAPPAEPPKETVTPATSIDDMLG